MIDYLKHISRDLVILLFFLLCHQFHVLSQSIVWQQVLPNNYGQLSRSVQTDDNSIISLGSDVLVHWKVYITKHTNEGQRVWIRYWGDNNNSYDGKWIEQKFDGGFIITGSTNKGPDGTLLLSIDSGGFEEWHTFMGLSDLDQGNCVKQTSDSGFVVLGRTTNSIGLDNILLAKTNKRGSIEWIRTLESISTQYAHELLIDNGKFVIVGYSNADFLLTTTDSLGNVIQTAAYGTAYPDAGYSIQKSESLGYYLAGTTYDSMGISRTLIIKIDSTGEVIWQKKYSAAYNEICFSGLLVPGRGFAFCGTTDSAYGELERGFVRIINPAGTVLSEVFYRGLQYFTELKSISRASDKGFILSGVTQAQSGGQPKMYLAKSDSLGNVFPLSIESSYEELPSDIYLYQNYPNPFNPQTRISFVMKFEQAITLQVFDITGRKIAVLLNGNIASGKHTVDFNSRIYNMSSGIYFCELKTNQKTMTRRMILLK